MSSRESAGLASTGLCGSNDRLRKRWKCGLRFRRLPSNIAVVTAIDGSRRSCVAGGMQVNHKRVLRMMRKDSLLAVRRRRFLVTTNSNHSFEVYLNLARRMSLTGIDQLWIADITYIRLEAEFVYLAVILDAFSR